MRLFGIPLPFGASRAGPGGTAGTGASPARAASAARTAVATPTPAEDDRGGGVPREVLRQVRLIELRTRGWVDSVFGGEYHSVFKGQGMEFSEVREYQAGDEVRNIEWNVTARSGVPFVKKHIEERELTVLIALDLSGSEQFGTRGRFKAELAAEIAAVLALSAVRNNDRVGLLIFTDTVEHFVPPRKGRRHVLRMIRDVLAFRPARTGTDLPAVLGHAARVLSNRSIVFLLSDFQQPGGASDAALERALRMVSRRHDLVAVTLTDVAEEVLPDAGLVVLTDPETLEELIVDTGDPRLRARYSQQAIVERETLRRVFRRLGVDEIEIRTDRSYIQPFLGFFRSREKRRSR